MMQTKKCDFCTKTLEMENIRDDKKYCDDICKNEYHSYKRRYAGILINSGQLDFQTVKEQVDKKQLGLKN